MMRVFPAGRLCSLRGVLMMWLLPAFVLVGAVSAAGAYWTYKSMVSTFMDDQMQLLQRGFNDANTQAAVKSGSFQLL